MKYLIAPSILSADLARLGDDVRNGGCASYGCSGG